MLLTGVDRLDNLKRMERKILKSALVATAGAIAGTVFLAGTAFAATAPQPQEAHVGLDGSIFITGSCESDFAITVEQVAFGIGAAYGTGTASCDRSDGTFAVQISRSSGVAFVPEVPVDVTTHGDGPSRTFKLMPEPGV